ncbi:MAG: carotenoid biosynthesis protein [Candidatus Zhuqueibacterota bacterium]
MNFNMRIFQPGMMPMSTPDKREWIVIGVMYFLLIAGGLWHALGLFQTLMRILAAPMLMALSLLVVGASLRRIDQPQARMLFILWGLFVFIASIAIEWLGVTTGKIFGEYHYSESLQPLLFGVPVAIGFAWLCMLLTSTAVAQKISGRNWRTHYFVRAAIIAALMVLFDGVMEAAVLKTGYWIWSGNSIPVQNYAAWYVISYGFALAGTRFNIMDVKYPAIVFHAYFAQILFFGLTVFKHN